LLYHFYRHIVKALLLFLTLIASVKLSAQTPDIKQVNEDMAAAAQAFWQALDPAQQKQAYYAYSDWERQNWDFVPHARKGLMLKQMNANQQQLAWALLKTGFSEAGYTKAQQIVDLENVLRVVENRPPNDTYRDPEGYYVTLFGEPGSPRPWGWRFEGHHLSVHFSSVTGKVLGLTPLFMGSNPGTVRADVPQKNRQILRDETEQAFALMSSLTAAQRTQATLAQKAFGDIVTGNTRRASLERMDGLPYADLTEAQKKIFLELLGTYLSRYHVTLARQQFDRIEAKSLDKIRFAWAGPATPGDTGGYYYRLHGPTLLIEYDNTQNDANHVHTVVRDLTNDFGEDLLRMHYEKK
jgi:hypothetical protein